MHLFHKHESFYDLFDRLAAHAVACAQHLRTMAEDFSQSKSQIQRIHDERRAADAVAHHTLERLTRAFIPPIHAEDVHALTRGLNEIVETVDAVATRLRTYHIDAMEPIFVKQTEVLLHGATTVSEAVRRLRETRKLSDLSSLLIEIHHSESVGDDYHHEALSVLFDGRSEALFVLKWKELHTLIEHAIDACEDVGNVLERIVLKNA